MAERIVSTKRCTKCGQIKPLEEFTKDASTRTGLGSHCRVCKRAARAAWYRSPSGHAMWKKYTQSKKFLEAIAAYRRTPKGKAVAAASTKKYRSTPKGRAKKYAIEATYRKRNPLKIRARAAIHSAVYDGRMVPASALICCRCGTKASEYHHHNGYDKEHRFDVVPVCQPCHKLLEAKQ